MLPSVCLLGQSSCLWSSYSSQAELSGMSLQSTTHAACCRISAVRQCLKASCPRTKPCDPVCFAFDCREPAWVYSLHVKHQHAYIQAYFTLPQDALHWQVDAPNPWPLCCSPGASQNVQTSHGCWPGSPSCTSLSSTCWQRWVCRTWWQLGRPIWSGACPGCQVLPPCTCHQF